MKRILLPALALLLAACESDSTGPDPVICNPLLTQNSGIPSDTVDAGDGLKYIDRQEGSGTPVASGADLEVHYSLYLEGIQNPIESTCPFQRTYDFKAGVGGTIAGFDRGVMGMRPGGVRRVIVPPSLGYGNFPSHELQYETLIFDIELVDILND